MPTPATRTTIEEREDGGFIVTVRAADGRTDRADLYAWGIPAGKRKIAERLARACRAGAVLTIGEIRTDINGKTFYSCRANILGRCMNADLKRLGF